MYYYALVKVCTSIDAVLLVLGPDLSFEDLSNKLPVVHWDGASWSYDV